MEQAVARILIADPDEYSCETIAACLERSGHEVVQAAHGEAAMTALVRHPPQLVLCEIMLPMRSGFEILASLGALGLARSIPVILVTADASQRAMDRALAEGVADYVVKPFHLRELTMRVNLALARREAALADEDAPRVGRPGAAGLKVVA